MKAIVCILWLLAVTECQRAHDALSIIRENGTRFDIVLSDVHMPDMDGFKFLELITSETDLPVVSKYKNLSSLYIYIAL